jgi:hypothetical protein
MTDEPKTELKRVQIDLPPKAFGRLMKLKADSEAPSYADVIRNALGLYAAVIDITEKGGELMVKQADGTVVPAYLISK